ncbi:RagB/SusD domain-containing protein [Flammeovirgaceae bacterium 311]|nr:RagB/SusD domain-containing protein [Flammeovirgaceae bacterium 311]
MKNLKYIFLSIIAATLVQGCNEDLLETIPNDRVSSEIFWQSDDDAIAAANAVYTYLPGLENTVNWDGMSDIAHITLMWRSESIIEKGSFDASIDKVNYEWDVAYQGIQTANTFLANIDRVQTLNPELIDRLKGEVRVLRAYHYIKLAMLFGDVPLVVTPLSIAEASSITRTPVSQIWDFISQEFTEAAALLPTTQEEKGRVTKGTALALKARAMLYAERYQQAADAAQQVMDLGVYSLYPSYENLFSYEAEHNQEVILDNQFIKDIRGNGSFRYLAPFSLQARGEVVPTKKAVDTYQMANGKDIMDPTSGFDPMNPYENRDPRLRYSIYVLGDMLPNGEIYNPLPGSGTGDAIGYSENSTPTGFNIKKYVNEEDLSEPWNSGINPILMRYAEVLLIYAEAKIELNQIDESVLDAINQVRQRPDVNMPPITSTSQEELRDIVRDERIREFAFEGLRYFDLRRWEIAEDVLPGIIYGMTYYSEEEGDFVTISMPSFVKAFNAGRDYLWPIPQSELELNQELSQNPGW